MLSASRQKFEENSFVTWSVPLSDNETIVELREGGKDQRVLYDERLDFIREALSVRLKES